jgi:hybrid cluster-associated redox disulfide protein
LIEKIKISLKKVGGIYMITKEMTLAQIIQIKEDAPQILMNFGMGCVGCPSSQAESLEDAAMVHGLNLDELLQALNK